MKFTTNVLMGACACACAWLAAVGATAPAAAATPAATTAAGQSASDAIEGTWVMNPAKSKFDGPGFASQTRTYSVAADGAVTLTIEGKTAGGAATPGGSSFKYDGQDYPYAGSADFDTIALRKVSATTTKIVLKKAGKRVGTGNRTIAADGKSYSLTTKVTGGDGKLHTSTMVFDKQ